MAGHYVFYEKQVFWKSNLGELGSNLLVNTSHRNTSLFFFIFGHGGPPNKERQTECFVQSRCLWFKTLLPAKKHLYASYWHLYGGCKVCFKDLQTLKNRNIVTELQRHKGVTLSVPSCTVLGGRMYRNNKLCYIVQPVKSGGLFCVGLQQSVVLCNNSRKIKLLDKSDLAQQLVG